MHGQTVLDTLEVGSEPRLSPRCFDVYQDSRSDINLDDVKNWQPLQAGLVIEDNETNQLLIGQYLAVAGLEYEFANHGETV